MEDIMLDLKFVRENPEIVKENIKNKFQDQKLPLVDEVIALDVENRKAQQEADALRSSRKTLSKQIGALMAQGKREEAEELKNKVNAQATALAELEIKETELQEIKEFDFKRERNLTSGDKETEFQEVKSFSPNYNNTNYIDLSYTNSINQSNQEIGESEQGKPDNDMIDVMDDATAYMEIIKENIEYEHHMKYGDWSEKGLYEELYEVICEIVCVKRRTVKVNGEDYPYELVKSKFLKLNSSHLEYVIGCMKETTTKITNIRAYMVTALYNAPNTMNHYYQQLVQHDMYGGGWQEKGLFNPEPEGKG